MAAASGWSLCRSRASTYGSSCSVALSAGTTSVSLWLPSVSVPVLSNDGGESPEVPRGRRPLTRHNRRAARATLLSTALGTEIASAPDLPRRAPPSPGRSWWQTARPPHDPCKEQHDRQREDHGHEDPPRSARQPLRRRTLGLARQSSSSSIEGSSEGRATFHFERPGAVMVPANTRCLGRRARNGRLASTSPRGRFSTGNAPRPHRRLVDAARPEQHDPVCGQTPARPE